MTQKVFINNNDMATFVCPECKKTKTTNVSKYKNINAALRVKVKCPCGHAYSVLLERRKYIRKDLKLPGTYRLEKDSDKGTMTIMDISKSGIRLKLSNKNITVGDMLHIEFRLDDPEESIINKEVVVRSIREDIIGTEFINKDHYGKLGTYLLFKLGF